MDGGDRGLSAGLPWPAMNLFPVIGLAASWGGSPTRPHTRILLVQIHTEEETLLSLA